MKKWLPKEERKTILFLSDDLQVFSGVGVMSREIVENTCGYYNWVQIGAATNHPQHGQFVEFSDEIAKSTGVDDPSVKIYPYSGYGDSRIVRKLMSEYNFDAILIFTDPRYWGWFFQMEHEIRQKVPIMYYNIWDGGWGSSPVAAPKYNKNYYRSCDGLFAISKQSYAVNKYVLGDEANEKIITYVPHGIDHKNKFYPIAVDDSKGLELMNKVKNEILGSNLELDFMVFYNARNLRRKMTSDVLLAYNHFLQKITPEEREGCRIVLHTSPIDNNGTDLLRVINDVVPEVKAIFSNTRVEADVLNALYNLADVTINLASNEGFGLGTCESIVAGTPILVNVTGGLQDQCGFMDDDGKLLHPDIHYTKEWGSNHDGRYKRHGEWAFPVFPKTRSLQGSPVTPYIFDDRCSWEEAGDRLYELYLMGREERKRRGLLGRKYALTDGQFTAEKMGELFIESSERTIENWTPRERYTLVKS